MKWQKLSITILISVVIMSFFVWYTHEESNNDAVKISLNLVRLECLKTTEPGTDEIYFNLTTLNSKGKSHLSRIPPIYNPGTRFPHSRFVHVSKGQLISNVTLSEERLKKGESMTIIISLMESDMSYAHPDTLIGAASVTVHNKNNTIETSWSVPKANTTSRATMTKKNQAYEFGMSDNTGSYKVILKLEEHY